MGERYDGSWEIANAANAIGFHAVDTISDSWPPSAALLSSQKKKESPNTYKHIFL